MFDELLLLTVFVLILAFIFTKGGAKYNLNILKAPEGHHMPTFDFFRLYFCLGVALFHCTIFPNAMKALKSLHEAGLDKSVPSFAAPQWLVFAGEDAFKPLIMTGVFSVDCFFVISGFFTTIGLIRQLMKGQNVDIFYAIAWRFLRLFPLIIIPMLWAMFRHDEAFYRDNDGNDGLLWSKVAGWLFMYGNLTGRDNIVKWYFDLSLTPLWSVVLDFQASIALILIVPVAYKMCGLQKMGYLFAFITILFVVVRGAVQFKDFDCLNGEALTGILANAGVMALTHARPFKDQMQREFGFTVFDMPMPPNTGCDMMVSDAAGQYFGLMYFPIWCRIAPFFVGAAMGSNYMWMKENKSEWTSESATVKTMKFYLSRVALIGSLLVVLYATFFAYLRNPEHMSTRAQGWWHIIQHASFGTGMACIIYSTLVPEDHPWHFSLLTWFTSLKCWFVCGGLSTWIYAIHWAVMWEFARAHLFKCEIASSFWYFFIVIPLTLPFAILCLMFYEPACEHTRRMIMTGEISIKKMLTGKSELLNGDEESQALLAKK